MWQDDEGERRHKKMPGKLSDQIINAAIDGFEAQRTRLDQQIAALRAMLPGSSAGTGTTPNGAPTKRRKFSAAALRRMREAQRQRWAKVRAETKATTKPARPKRRISKQGLKNIIAATKRRWALQRLEGAKPGKPPARGKGPWSKRRVSCAPESTTYRSGAYQQCLRTSDTYRRVPFWL